MNADPGEVSGSAHAIIWHRRSKGHCSECTELTLHWRMDYEGDEPGDARDVAARAVTLARLFNAASATGWNTSVGAFTDRSFS